MIASFFRDLERERVAYLLISGQAAVLYGASTFSEDIDLWIRPSRENAAALLAALGRAHAVYYKLTPPVEPEFLIRGHGFHFRVPDDPDFYLDVMGRPPRVPDFDVCRSEAAVIETGWGRIPTMGIKHLVDLKATQRVEDYPVISRLVIRYMEDRPAPNEGDCRWAVRNVYTVNELAELLREVPRVADACDGEPALMRFAEEILRNGDAGEQVRAEAESLLLDRARLAMRADRVYWKDIIRELRDLRARGLLMPVGQPVSPRSAT
ncbi:MAG: hypothetical protein JXB04_11270 [Kiritimatiellae bacterium]|nr:hypothetical protein [Kiritimatiellia bacterium]